MWRLPTSGHQYATQNRITLTKLQLSNHKLALETGRYSRPFKKPEERIYPICKIEIEDEYHFLNICPDYQEKKMFVTIDYLNKKTNGKTCIQMLWKDKRGRRQKVNTLGMNELITY